jgi:hypothetical protein
MSRLERPPDLLERVESGIREWSRTHYGGDGQMRAPALAQGIANGLAGALRRAGADKSLAAVHRVWAENIALGVELLADAELFAEVPGYETRIDTVEAVHRLGWRMRKRREAEQERRVQWFITGAGLGALVAYVLVQIF